MVKILKFSFLALLFFVFACNAKKEPLKITENPKPDISSGELIPIDLNDSTYIDVNFYCKDTITKSGWKIAYFVKDDQTKYNDLYIKWSKGSVSGTFVLEDCLIMRSFFIPLYKDESSTNIYLAHGCSTSGAALLVLPKNTQKQANDYCDIIDYSVEHDKVGFIPTINFSRNKFEVAVADLNTGTEKSVIFQNKCALTPEASCIDKIDFKSKSVAITATLIDKRDELGEKTIVEKHTIDF